MLNKKTTPTLNIPEIVGSVIGSVFADNVQSGGSGIPSNAKSAMNPAITAIVSNVSYQYAIGLKPVSDLVSGLDGGDSNATVVQTVYSWLVSMAYAMAIDKEKPDAQRRLIQAIVQVYTSNIMKDKTF